MNKKPWGAKGLGVKMPTVSQFDNVRIRDITREGDGIGSLPDGRVVFVSGALPGEVATVELTGNRKGILRARLVTLDKKAKKRIDPPCPHFNKCGGCLLMNLEYSGQIEIKNRLTPEAMKRIGGFDGPIPPIKDGTGKIGPENSEEKVNTPLLGYRNKGVFRIRSDPSNGRPMIGMFSAGTRKLVEIDSCLVQSRGNNRSLELLRNRLKEIHQNGSETEMWALMALDEVTLRNSTGGDSMLVLGFREDSSGFRDAPAWKGPSGKSPTGKGPALMGKALAGGVFEGISSIWCGLVQPGTSGIDPYTAVHLKGAPQIRETIGTSLFKIGPCSFFQVNTSMAASLVETVRMICAPSPRAGQGVESGPPARKKDSGDLLDLYCGAGLFSICLSDAFAKVTGIESSRAAVTEARANATGNSAKNASFISGNVEETLTELLQGERNFVRPEKKLTVLLDPPRKGCGPVVAEAISRLGADKIVYVSCDPATLARDAALIRKNGYVLKGIHGIDMFPQTMHMETVAVFLKNSVK